MKYLGKLGVLTATVCMAAVVFVIGMIKVPEWMVKRNIADVDQYAVNVEDMAIPDEAADVRANHKFCSGDPLAAQADRYDGVIYVYDATPIQPHLELIGSISEGESKNIHWVE